MSTEVCTSLGLSAALDLANNSASNAAPGVKYDIACPSPSPTPDINSPPTVTPDGLANLTPLPAQSPNEIQDLDPNYPNYRATIHYYTSCPNDTLTRVTHPTPVSRTSVLLSLEYFYTLRKHLVANLSILLTYPDAALAAIHESSSSSRRSATLTALETVQCAFAMHHIAINENLRAVNSDWGCHAFGLPDPLGAAADIRHDRNFFAHSFPTPVGKGVELVWAVKGKRDVYAGLLELVERNVDALEGQLDDASVWVSLEKLDKERMEREAWEEKERQNREGVEQEDDKKGVYEGEEEVNWMEVPQSRFSRVFDSLGGNAVVRYCLRFGVVRNAGSRLWAWLGEMLEEADAVALRKAGENIAREYGEGQVLAEASTATRFRGEEGVPAEYGEGDDWKSQEYKIGDDDCRSHEYKVENSEGYGSQDIDAPPSQPDSGWGEPQW